MGRRPDFDLDLRPLGFLERRVGTGEPLDFAVASLLVHPLYVALLAHFEGFTGIDAPFEEPERPEVEVEVRTATHSRETNIRRINTELDRKFEPSHVFIGRWQPLHDGHRTIIDSAADNGKHVVIAIRDTELSEKNPLTAQERRELIEDVYEDHPNVETMILPDVDTVAIGRDVGYSVVSVPEEVAEISGTETREEYEKSELVAGQHLGVNGSRRHPKDG